MSNPIFDVTIKRLLPQTDRLAIEARSPQEAILKVREAMGPTGWSPVAVDELDLIGTCSRCGLTLFDGDFAMKVHGLVYCRDCMPDENERTDLSIGNDNRLTWLEWVEYRLDCLKVWFAGRA